MRRILPWAALVVLALALVMPLRAQFTGGGGGGSVAIESGSGLPTNPANGQIAVRTIDRQMFVYHSDLGKWLGELKLLVFSRSGVDFTGPLAIGQVNLSTASPFLGYDAGSDSLRILKVQGHCGDATAPNCTTRIQNDGNTLMTLTWDTNEETWEAGVGGWGAGVRVAIPPGGTMTFSVVSGGAQLADSPIVLVYCRDEVSP